MESAKRMNAKKDFKYQLILLLPVVCLLFGELFFFRNMIGSDLMAGDRGDARLGMLIAEHWHRVFEGKEPVSQLNMFYPAQNTIAHSDMMLGYGIVHSLFRIIGFNMFESFKYTLILIHCAGTLSAYYLLRRKWKLQISWSMIGTAAFAFSNVYAFKFNHTQLNAMAFVPLLLIAVTALFQSFDKRRKRNRSAYAAILIFALILYTSWYVAFFTLLFCSLFIVIFLIESYCKDGRKEFLSMIGNFFVELGWDVFNYLLLAAAVVVPFIILYIPILKMNGSRSYTEAAAYLPEFMDFFNVTTDNLLFGSFIQKMNLSNGETAEGYSLVFWLLFVYLAFFRKKDKCLFENYLMNRVCNCVIYAVLISFFIILKLSSNGVSLWMFIYKFVPGAGAIRAVSRYLFFLTFPMSMIIAVIGHKVSLESTARSLHLCVILGAALFVSNIYGDGINAHWNIAEEEKFLDSVSQPPSDCDVFYIKDTSGNEELAYAYQLDALEIAARFGIKTINGYSDINLEHWDGIREVCADGYESSVGHWIEYNGLLNVYSYDKATNVWEKRNSCN